MPSRRRRTVSLAPTAKLVAVVLCVAGFVASPAAAVGPLYCDGALDGGLTGALTDAEHAVKTGDPPLPAGVTQRRLDVDGISTRLLEAGPSEADEAVVFVHGNPGSARDFDGLMASTGRLERAIAFDFPGLGHADDRRGLDYSIAGVDNAEAREVAVRADEKEFRARVRLDTPREREYLRHGGILPLVLRRLLAG